MRLAARQSWACELVWPWSWNGSTLCRARTGTKGRQCRWKLVLVAPFVPLSGYSRNRRNRRQQMGTRCIRSRHLRNHHHRHPSLQEFPSLAHPSLRQLRQRQQLLKFRPMNHPQHSLPLQFRFRTIPQSEPIPAQPNLRSKSHQNQRRSANRHRLAGGTY